MYLYFMTIRPGPVAQHTRLNRSGCAWWSLLVAAVFVGVSATAQTVVPPAANTLKIGVIGPFTGASADFGMPMLNGIEQAVDEINAVGGYLGLKIELVRKDDQANPDLGVKLSQELVAEKVIASIGFCNTGVAAK